MAVSHHIRAKGPSSHPSPALKKAAVAATVRGGRPNITPALVTAPDLRAVVLRLCRIRAAVLTAAAALRAQNADLDADVALALEPGAIDPLTFEIEKFEALLGVSREKVNRASRDSHE